MTPKQILIDLKGKSEQRRQEHNDQMSLAWHTAMLHRIDPKKFPKLKHLLKSANARPAPQQQNWRDQFAAVEAWVRAKGP